VRETVKHRRKRRKRLLPKRCEAALRRIGKGEIFLEEIYCVLIISPSEKTAESLALAVPELARWQWERAEDRHAALDILSKKRYDLVIMNVKSSEDYDALCRISGGEHVTAALMNARFYEKYAADALGRGIAPLKKPLGSEEAGAVFTALTASAVKVRRLTERADGIRATMDDMKIITRAKLLLMDRLKMDEAAAHRYIEKQAMNMRISRRKVAEGIIGTYEM
jgi:response regulator NasT